MWSRVTKAFIDLQVRLNSRAYANGVLMLNPSASDEEIARKTVALGKALLIEQAKQSTESTTH